MAALDNEKFILKRINDKFKTSISKTSSVNITDELIVSVDFIHKEKNYKFLFEIDSYSATKIIFGQYILLNQIKSFRSNCILVIIHCYPKYSVNRTEKYLKYAIKKLKCSIPFVIFTKKDFIELIESKSKSLILKHIVESAINKL